VAAYQETYRRLLLDMHVPDWDEGFLAQLDPAALVDRFAASGAAAVMVYTKSHVGLCYWPTRIGRQHQALGRRDVLAEVVAGLRRHDLGVCAYYSVVFDNWAAEHHPEWRQVNVAGVDFWPFMRYGVCCPNNEEYRAYERDLFVEMLATNQFDAVFADMLFWPLICGCPSCQARYRAEEGAAIPDRIDWFSPEWNRFQAARERWADELAADFAALVRQRAPGTAFTHNFAPAWMGDWHMGQPILASRHDDFVAGDLYGDRTEQLVVSKLMLHLGQGRPPEFMTSATVDLRDHSRRKSARSLRAQALAATSVSAAFLVIDAINPDGTLEPGLYRQLPDVLGASTDYEAFLGGEPVEDVVVYFATDAQVDLAENGKPVTDAGQATGRCRHLDAVRGACTALQRAHLPFGVITRGGLAELAPHQVVVVPNAERLGADEVLGLRRHLDKGGAIYASRFTSLVDTQSGLADNFALADVLGVDLDSHEEGGFVYLRPEPQAAAWVAPASVVSYPLRSGGPLATIPRITARRGTEVLARLTVPYGHPHAGSAADKRWSSIHASPPWQALDVPTMVAARAGAGRSIYCTADIESVDSEAAQGLFIGAVRRLMDRPPAFEVDGHPCLWASAFAQPDQSRSVLSLLNYPADLPPVAMPVGFRFRPPEGNRLRRAFAVPEQAGLTVDGSGAEVVGHVEAVPELVLLILEWDGRA